jgi:hypothetical protein
MSMARMRNDAPVEVVATEGAGSGGRPVFEPNLADVVRTG